MTRLRQQRRSTEELRAIAADGARLLSGARAEQVVDWAVEQFGTAWAVASSMQDAVLVSLVSRRVPGVDVLFLDTGYHFTETLATRAEVSRRYPVRVRDLAAAMSHAEQDLAYGRDLFDSNPDLCCLLRKRAPLDEALQGYEAWATGARRAESPSRSDLAVVSFDDGHGLVRLAPLAHWTDQQVAEYAQRHAVPRNPLLDQGYPSIGCAPCTSPVPAGADPRSGRWAGRAKTECGIHR